MYNVYLQDLHNINMKPKVQKVCCAINRCLHAHFFLPLFPFLTNFITDSFLFWEILLNMSYIKKNLILQSVLQITSVIACFLNTHASINKKKCTVKNGFVYLISKPASKKSTLFITTGSGCKVLYCLFSGEKNNPNR